MDNNTTFLHNTLHFFQIFFAFLNKLHNFANENSNLRHVLGEHSHKQDTK